ncbi:MAG: TetR/AcrR family transcriptional regulator [Planctomycetota bacterium]|nr:TetR/AcrR family transcriptional regulator [Planctomycetota bacterium]
MKVPPNIDRPKARQVLAGAKAAFLELGYEGTSVDELARRAGISKATLYSHFVDKEAVFRAFINAECQEQVARMFTIEPSGETPAEVLLRVASSYIECLVSPFAMDFFRLVVAECQRFSDIGREFFDSGPDIAIRRLAQFLTAADARGELHVANPELAAHQFTSLCKAELFYKRLLGVKSIASPSEIQRAAKEAVATFLKAYGR